MNEGRKRYKAVIGKKAYTIIGKETKAHMDMVTVLVNEQLSEIAEKAPNITSEQQAILLAFNTVSDQVKKQIELNALQKEAASLKEKVANYADKLVKYEKKAHYLEEQATHFEQVEKRLRRYEEMEEQAKQALKESGQPKNQLTPAEAQEILNKQKKEKIAQGKVESKNA